MRSVDLGTTGGVREFLKQKKSKAGVNSGTLGRSREIDGGRSNWEVADLLQVILTACTYKWQNGNKEAQTGTRKHRLGHTNC